MTKFQCSVNQQIITAVVVAIVVTLIVVRSFFPFVQYDFQTIQNVVSEVVEPETEKGKNIDIDESEKTCDNLLDYGMEINLNGTPKWRPFNCEMVSYRNASNLRKCMEKLPSASKRSRPSILFIGDSRMRQLQIALHRELTGRTKLLLSDLTNNAEYCDKPEAKNHVWFTEVLQQCSINLTVLPYNFGIERLWAPFFQTSTVATELQRVLALPDDQAPNMIIITSGLWLIRDCHNKKIPFHDCYQMYERNITIMLPDLERLTERSTVIWTLQSNLQPCNVWPEMKMFYMLPIFNDLAVRIFRNTKIKIWRSYFQIFDYLLPTDGEQHMGEEQLKVEMQIIFNFLCNEIVESDPKFCCVRSSQNDSGSMTML